MENIRFKYFTFIRINQENNKWRHNVKFLLLSIIKSLEDILHIFSNNIGIKEYIKHVVLDICGKCDP